MKVMTAEEATGIKESLDEASRLARSRDPVEVARGVAMVEDLLSRYPCYVPLLVAAAELVQICDTFGEDLRDACELFKVASILDPLNVDCLEEHARFLWAIDNSASEAIELFELLHREGTRAVRASLYGQVKCSIELGRYDRAEELLAEYKCLCGEFDEYAELEQEVLQERNRLREPEQ